MPLADEDERAIDEALRAWRQGDVSLDAGLEFLHLADLSRPHSPASRQVAEDMANNGEALEAGAMPVLDEVLGKHDKETEEGAHLRVLREIRVRAVPSWEDDRVQLGWWFVKEADPVNVDADWPKFLEQWLTLFDQSGRFHLDSRIACRLEDMTARDYVESDRLDLDRLSVHRQT